MDIQLKSMCRQSITRASLTGVNAYGEPSFSTSETLLVRLIGKQELIRSHDGSQVVSDRQFVTEESVAIDDRVWLPNESTSSDEPHIPQAISWRVDEDGESDYYKVYL